MPIRKANTLKVQDIINLDGYPVQIARMIPNGGTFFIDWVEVGGERCGTRMVSHSQGIEKILEEPDGVPEPEKPQYVDTFRPAWMPPIPAIQVEA